MRVAKIMPIMLSVVMLSACANNVQEQHKDDQTAAVSSTIEEQIVEETTETATETSSSEEMKESSEKSSSETTEIEQEASDVPLYDRTYLEKDGEGYIYRLSDPELIAKYDELYADAFTSVVDSYNERISWMNQSYKSDQKVSMNNLVLKNDSENQVISTGSDFEMDYNFDLLNVGYTYVDLDSDGAFELIFGVLSYVYNDGFPMDNYERAFALSNSKVVKIMEGGSRMYHWLGSDGHIYEDGSGGAAYSGTWRLHFDKSELDGNDVDWGDIAFKEDEFLGYWERPVHIVGPITDMDMMAKLPESQIADDEWNALEKELDARRVRIDWLRLSDYLNNK